MLRLNTTSTGENIIGYSLSGTIDGYAVEALVGRIREVAETRGPIRLYAEIGEFKEFKNMTSMFASLRKAISLIGKVEKYAVITDRPFVTTTAKIEGALMPGMDIKTFSSSEKTAAMDWLREPTVENTRSVVAIPLENEKVLGLRINGMLSKVDYDYMEARLNQQLATCGQVNLYLEVPKLTGITIKALWSKMHVEFKYIGKISKLALVTGYPLGTATQILDFITPSIDVKFFCETESERAKQWVR